MTQRSQFFPYFPITTRVWFSHSRKCGFIRKHRNEINLEHHPKCICLLPSLEERALIYWSAVHLACSSPPRQTESRLQCFRSWTRTLYRWPVCISSGDRIRMWILCSDSSRNDREKITKNLKIYWAISSWSRGGVEGPGCLNRSRVLPLKRRKQRPGFLLLPDGQSGPGSSDGKPMLLIEFSGRVRQGVRLHWIIWKPESDTGRCAELLGTV